MAADEEFLTRREGQDKICFVIMPFSVPEGYDSDHFEKVYDQIFVPAENPRDSSLSSLLSSPSYQHAVDVR